VASWGNTSATLGGAAGVGDNLGQTPLGVLSWTPSWAARSATEVVPFPGCENAESVVRIESKSKARSKSKVENKVKNEVKGNGQECPSTRFVARANSRFLTGLSPGSE
jgi:hypothetical protein